MVLPTLKHSIIAKLSARQIRSGFSRWCENTSYELSGKLSTTGTSFHAGVSPTGRAGDCKAVLKKEGFFSPPVQLY